MRVVGIIQARMGSQRLPGKVLRPLAGRSVLGWVVRAAQESRGLDELLVATSDRPEDDAVVAECARLGVRCVRGDRDDVLSRFIHALDTVDAEAGPVDAVMRFTADCPLLDPALIATALRVFRAEPGLDYLSTALHRVLPRGLDVEIASAAALRRVHTLATAHHRVHVTSYLYTHPDQFRLLGLTFLPDHSDLRVTLDTIEDWRLIEAVVAHFGDRTIPAGDLIRFLLDNPQIRALNQAIRQKELVEG
jgi:spore coat polysaccharide biosynthesis protein SpsF